MTLDELTVAEVARRLEAKADEYRERARAGPSDEYVRLMERGIVLLDVAMAIQRGESTPAPAMPESVRDAMDTVVEAALNDVSECLSKGGEGNMRWAARVREAIAAVAQGMETRERS